MIEFSRENYALNKWQVAEHYFSREYLSVPLIPLRQYIAEVAGYRFGSNQCRMVSDILWHGQCDREASCHPTPPLATNLHLPPSESTHPLPPAVTSFFARLTVPLPPEGRPQRDEPVHAPPPPPPPRPSCCRPPPGSVRLGY